jgi:predicted GNAT family acetyltransferase
VTAPPDDLEIVDNPDESRYEARLGGRVVGISQYELGDRRITFLHTEVDPSVEGRGIGSRLARGVLADARRRGLGVTALCPFIAAFLRRHQGEYEDLVGK